MPPILIRPATLAFAHEFSRFFFFFVRLIPFFAFSALLFCFHIVLFALLLFFTPSVPFLLAQQADSDLFGTGSKYTKNRNRHRINKAIAKYLDRESDNYDTGLGASPFGNYEFDDEREQQTNPGNLYVDEKRKRSSSSPSSSAFRERDEQYGK